MNPPRLLTLNDNLTDFNCGVDALNDWLKRRALINLSLGASKTYVATKGSIVIGYCSLSASSVAHLNAPGKIRRNMPDPIPVILMGRLAVDTSQKGKGVGAGLVLDALSRVRLLAESVGIRGMMVNAKDENVAKFYQHLGFVQSPNNPLLLFALTP